MGNFKLESKDDFKSKLKSEIKSKTGHLYIKISIILAILVAVINTLETFYIVESTKSKVQNLNIQNYSQTASIYSDLIKKTTEEYMAHLDLYTKSEELKTLDNFEIMSLLEKHRDTRPESFDYIGWVDKDGNMFSDLGAVTRVVDRDYYKSIVINGADYYIDDPTTSKTNGKTIVHICKAAKVNGRTVGLFMGVVTTDKMSLLLDGIDLEHQGAALLVSGDGQLIATSGEENIINCADEILNQNNNNKKSLKDNSNIFWTTLSTGERILDISSSIDGISWNMIILVKEQLVFGMAKQIGSTMIKFSILLATIIILSIGLSIAITLRPLSIVDEAINNIASGNADLTKRIGIEQNNEIGRVVDSFNKFSEKLQTIIKSIKGTKNELVNAGQLLSTSTSDTTSAITQISSNIESMEHNITNQTNSVTQTVGAVNQIASNIDSLNSMIENQSSAVSQASSAVEEMIGNINSVNNSVQKMADEFHQLEIKTQTGVQKQDDVNNKIEIIEDQSQALQEANAVISSIAEQTNLLAMNAAIEAAHAGEAGKGFSVVADEIRKLSETSSAQSKTIGEQLKKIIDGIQEIVSASTQARGALSEVSSHIFTTNDLVLEISKSMTEQEDGSKQIVQALTHMNDSTSQVRTASLEMAAGNKAILDEVKKLQDESISMKAGMDEMAVGAKQILATGNELSHISEEMELSIAQIGEQVDLFKV